MKRARNVLGGLLGLLLLAALALGIGVLLRTTGQPSTAAGPPQPMGLPASTTQLTATAALTSSPTVTPVATVLPAPTIQLTATLPSTPTPVTEAIPAILFASSEGLQWLPAGERLTEATPAQLDLPIAQGERGETVEIGTLYPSPDGRHVAFFVAYTPPIEGTEGWWRMYVWSPYLDQPLREILSAAEFGLDFKFFGWRPSSRQIVCWSDVGWQGIFLLDVETGERTRVIQPKEWANLPYSPAVDGLAFSPDGEQMIVSFKPMGEDWEVWIARSDGTKARQLFTSPGFVAGMSWSPDGKWVSFINRGVEVMSPDGQGRRTVGTRFIGGLAPVWSPDSRYLAFTANNPTASEPSHDTQDPGTDFSPYTVRIADVLTGEERDLVTDTIGGGIGARWSPDGSQVVFLSDRSGATEVWVADADGANLRQVTFDGRPKRGTPAWISLHLP